MQRLLHALQRPARSVDLRAPWQAHAFRLSDPLIHLSLFFNNRPLTLNPHTPLIT
jgi:hypothetical protein